MGMFSYNCKECGHPLLCPRATSPGINDWMSQAVVLTQGYPPFAGEYDGYGRVGELEELIGRVCLHEACWEKAGKPEATRYDAPSSHAADQGWFFDDGAHDLIDPRITENRDERLAAGRAARAKQRYDDKARRVRDWVANGPITEETPTYERRFSFSPCYEGREPTENKWLLSDRLHERFQDEADWYFMGTEEEAEAFCSKQWADFLVSDECKTLLAHAEEMRLEGLRRFAAHLREKGRFTVGYGNSVKGGDVVNGDKLYRRLHYVQDNLTFERVALFDYEGESKVFEKIPGYRGNNSPEWETRVEENRADDRARCAKAQAEADRLEAAWAAEGKPITFEGETL